MIYALQLKEYKPILAHFERYAYYHGRTHEAEELIDRGVKIQINILSLFLAITDLRFKNKPNYL